MRAQDKSSPPARRPSERPTFCICVQRGAAHLVALATIEFEFEFEFELATSNSNLEFLWETSAFELNSEAASGEFLLLDSVLVL